MEQKVLIVLLICTAVAHVAAVTEEQLTEYLFGEYEVKASEMCFDSNQAEWNYQTDISETNSAKLTETTLKVAKFNKEVYNNWFKDVDLNSIKDPTVARMMGDLKKQDTAALSEADLEKLTNAVNSMSGIYSAAKICPFDKKDTCTDALKTVPLEVIEDILANPDTTYDELKYAWESWHEESGKKMRADYKTYVEYSNKMAKENNFEDKGAYWRDSFQTENFEETLDSIWKQLQPFYKALHKHVSEKLKEKHGEALDNSDGLLPAHVFGNVWAQSWGNLDALVKPHPNESVVDITKALNDQKYTVKKIFETSDEFYTSLGLPTNKMSYGNGSMIEKPDGKEVTCHASAWDFCDKQTFRIKMCTKINQEDFVTVHHEMGHIQYYLQYKDQPLSFRGGANPGFHEAVGDTMALSVQSIKHLKQIGLVDAKFQETDEASLNALMSMALEKIAFMPFGYLIDKWRWNVFSGKTKESEWNKHWWELRKEYQLVKPPTERNETFFDPGAKYHVAADSQYISYFISHILQFQFYRALCIEAGEYDPVAKSPPLHQCDFYKNQKAGALLAKGLSLGSSKPWPEVLKIMTGTEELDVNPLLEYFEPLTDYLEVFNGSSLHMAHPSLFFS